MKRRAFLVSLLALPAIAHAGTPAREDAAQIWKVAHPASGSVATPVKAGPLELEFPYGPLVSGKNIDLPPVLAKVEGLDGKAWTRWTIPAWIKVKETETLPLGGKPGKGYRNWRLFARLRDGRVVEAGWDQSGTDSAYTDGTSSRHTVGKRFKLVTSVGGRRAFEKRQKQAGAWHISGNLPEKPVLWRDVIELWLVR